MSYNSFTLTDKFNKLINNSEPDITDMILNRDKCEYDFLVDKILYGSDIIKDSEIVEEFKKCEIKLNNVGRILREILKNKYHFTCDKYYNIEYIEDFIEMFKTVADYYWYYNFKKADIVLKIEETAFKLHHITSLLFDEYTKSKLNKKSSYLDWLNTEPDLTIYFKFNPSILTISSYSEKFVESQNVYPLPEHYIKTLNKLCDLIFVCLTTK